MTEPRKPKTVEETLGYIAWDIKKIKEEFMKISEMLSEILKKKNDDKTYKEMPF